MGEIYLYEQQLAAVQVVKDTDSYAAVAGKIREAELASMTKLAV